MRRSLWALVATGVIAAAAASPAAAGGSPFCIKGCTYGGAGGFGDCSFSSYEQCEATASGQAATCVSNPYFSAKAEMLPDRGRLSRKKN